MYLNDLFDKILVSPHHLLMFRTAWWNGEGKKCHWAFTVTHSCEKNEQAALCVLYSEGPFIQKWRDVFKQAQEVKQDAERESTACFQCRRDFLLLSWHHNVLEVQYAVSVLITFWNIHICTQIDVIVESLCNAWKQSKRKMLDIYNGSCLSVLSVVKPLKLVESSRSPQQLARLALHATVSSCWRSEYI